MADIFNKSGAQTKSPITADRCKITIDGNVIAEAIQFQCNYAQPTNRRRTIGNQVALIYTGMPSGQISIARLLSSDAASVFSSKIFSCEGGDISFTGTGCTGGSIRFVARGAMVSSYSFSASADDSTVADNITIDFLELSRT